MTNTLLQARLHHQAFQILIIQTAGALIGICAALLLYGHVLEAYGLVQFLVGILVIGLPLLSLGAYHLSYRYIPQLGDDKGAQAAFLVLLLAWGALAVLGMSLTGALAICNRRFQKGADR